VPGDRELKAFVLEQVQKSGKEPLRLSDLQTAMCTRYPAADYRRLTGAKLSEMLEVLLEKTTVSLRTKGLRRVLVNAPPVPIPAPGSGARIVPAAKPAAKPAAAPPPPAKTSAPPEPSPGYRETPGDGQRPAPRARYDFTGFTAVPATLNLKTLETFCENILIWLREKQRLERVEIKEFYDAMRSLEPRIVYTDYGFFDQQQLLLYLLSRKKQRVVRDNYGNRFILLRPPLENEKVLRFAYDSAEDYTYAQVKKAVGLLGTDLTQVKGMLEGLVAANWTTYPKQDFFENYVLPYSGKVNGGLFMHILGAFVLITWKNDIVTRTQEVVHASGILALLPYLLAGARRKVAHVKVPESVFLLLEKELRAGMELPAVANQGGDTGRRGGGLLKKLFG
jgi:hypothetical protein